MLWTVQITREISVQNARLENDLSEHKDVPLECLLGPSTLEAKESELLGVEETPGAGSNSDTKESRQQKIEKLEVAKAEKEQEIARFTTEQVEQRALNQARKLATVGTGEKTPAHGFTLIVGDSLQLLDPQIGGFNDSIHDYRGKGKTVDDFKVLQAAITNDGAVVIDRSTGALICANYFVFNIGAGDASGGARHRSASAIAQQCGGCYVIKASDDACGIAASKIPDAELSVFYNSVTPTAERVHPDGS